MRSIIDSLLLFAQVGHAEIEIDPIKMRDLAEQVKRSLKHEIEAKSATVTVEGDDWPTALGHEPWVELPFQCSQIRRNASQDRSQMEYGKPWGP
jgi:signal transduction histidine kinase